MLRNNLVQRRITSGFINVVADEHYIPAFWAHPEIGGTFPGLVLIHEWWGMTSHMRTQVRRFAELGFYVIAPDLFNGRTASNADEALALQQELGEAGPPLISAAIRALETHHRVNGKIGMVGWHLGGQLALHAAMHRTDLRAVATFYARPDDYLTIMPADETPLLMFYGERDETCPPEMLDKVRTALQKSPGKGEVVVYPGATTGFFNDDLPTYNQEAAHDAWEKLLDFLTEKLDIQAYSKSKLPSEQDDKNRR
jgi:carboxymethylenebutenolidase